MKNTRGTFDGWLLLCGRTKNEVDGYSCRVLVCIHVNYEGRCERWVIPSLGFLGMGPNQKRKGRPMPMGDFQRNRNLNDERFRRHFIFTLH